MTRIRSERFDIDESSWGSEISGNIIRLLEAIPVDDVDIDVLKIVYDGLVHFFGEHWCVVGGIEVDLAINALNDYSHGYMFSVYDYMKDMNIVCFKPDPLRGKYKKFFTGCEDTHNELSLKVYENSMSDELYRYTTDSIKRIIPETVEESAELEIAGIIRTALFDKFTGVYQVIVGVDQPIEYHIDPISVDRLYVQIGSFYVLIWKQVISTSMLKIPNRFHWTESTWVSVVWLTVIFLIVVVYANLSKKVSQTASACEGDVCEGLISTSTDTIITLLGRIALLLVMLYGYYFVYRLMRHRQRHTCDMKFYASSIGDKKDK